MRQSYIFEVNNLDLTKDSQYILVIIDLIDNFDLLFNNKNS